ncbi:MAG: hypothetical protein ACI97A_003254 [Planctomycetota bacterium]|jgi:hypothetical protein
MLPTNSTRLMCSSFFFLILSLSCSAQSLTHTYDGPDDDDLLGFAVSDAGDVNNDGFDDVIIGSFGDDPNGVDSGSAQVISGVNGTVLYTFSSAFAGDYFGFSVGAAGDVNNDGFADVIVGALQNDVNGTGAGAAQVFSGQNGSVLFTVFGDNSDDFFGVSVSGLGDLNNDGFDDFAVGAFGDDDQGLDSGSVRVFSGFDGSTMMTLYGLAAGDRFGTSVSGTGDVNNDGTNDFVVGAPTKFSTNPGAGAAFVFSGSTGAHLHTFQGVGGGDHFGVSVSGAGDVNNDGFDDIIVGADHEEQAGNVPAGSARVFSGLDGSLLHNFKGTSLYGQFGLSVSDAGDVDGDGSPDVIVGAPLSNSFGLLRSGSATVFSGSDGDVITVLNGTGLKDRFGWSVSGAGDTNGDGLSDLVIGAPQFEDFSGGLPQDSLSGQAQIFSTRKLDVINGNHANAFFGIAVSGAGDVNGDGLDDVIASGLSTNSANVYSAADGSILYKFEGDNIDDVFGLSVSDAGDVNGDGFADVIIGAPFDDNNGTQSGSARVHSGVDGSILYTFDGNAAGHQFGYCVDRAGDVDADGIPDFIVGAIHAGADTGKAIVFSGANGSIIHVLAGGAAGDIFGAKAAGAGDVNGDGFDDLIVSAIGHDLPPAAPGGSTVSNAGEVQVFSGLDGSVLYTKNGDSFNGIFGSAVSGAGDLDCDGFDEFIIGHSGFSVPGPGGNNIGQALVYSGFDGTVMFTFNGSGANANFGASVDGLGDFNGDGTPDVIIGGLRSLGLHEGASVFSGVDGSQLAAYSGEFPSEFGGSVRGAGDINADGFDDVIIGAARDFVNGQDSGSVHVFRAEALPSFVYDSELESSRLKLRWKPNAGDPNALVGEISCTGATPGAFGSYGTSLAPANLVVFGIPLLIAIDGINLIDSGDFGFGFAGELNFPGLSRQAPALAGVSIFIQFFEISPILSSSNGVRLELAP